MSKEDEFLRQTNKYKFIYSILGLVLGLLCTIGGIILFLNGIAGSTSWTAEILGIESNIADAAPGAILFIVGLFAVYITKYKVKYSKGNDSYGPYRNVYFNEIILPSEDEESDKKDSDDNS